MRYTLSQLNRDTQSYSMRWKKYRQSIDEIINPYIFGETLIIGAGNGNDLVYPNIFRQATDVDIVDIDIASVKRGLLGFQARVRELIELDLTGIVSQEKIDVGSIEFKTVHLTNSYDTIIITPVISQLFFNTTMAELREKNGTIDQQTIEKLLKTTQEVIERFAALINRTVRPGGTLIMWNDLLQFPPLDPFFDNLSFSKGEQYVKEYTDEYGLSPVIYGNQLIKELGEIISGDFLHWNFNDQKSFLVELSIIKI